MSKLIFDIGFHKGEDTKYYLSRGYNVIGVEANLELVVNAYTNIFKNETQDKRLILLNYAISDNKEKVPFYIQENRTEISSVHKYIAEQDGNKSIEVFVKPITIIDLYEYGVPYYVKVDVEGCDTLIAKDLLNLKVLPQFISFELNKIDYATIFSYLHLAGYKQFQLRNQLNNVNGSSGEFGEFLPKDKWITFDEALSQYIKYRELKIIDNKNLALGWMDIHAKLS